MVSPELLPCNTFREWGPSAYSPPGARPCHIICCLTPWALACGIGSLLLSCDCLYFNCTQLQPL